MIVTVLERRGGERLVKQELSMKEIEANRKEIEREEEKDATPCQTRALGMAVCVSRERRGQGGHSRWVAYK